MPVHTSRRQRTKSRTTGSASSAGAQATATRLGPTPVTGRWTTPGRCRSGPTLKLRGGTAFGHSEAQLHNRVITDPYEVQTLDLRYGIVRAQALTPRKSLAFIEKVMGEET
ncbi:hypothetical protein STENM223S_11657 [Streptomyces tendae]